MLKNIISDFTANASWELIFVIMLTIIARIIRLTVGKKMTTKHEIMFWIGCIFCGTCALAVLNAGVINPIKAKLTNLRIDSPNLHCFFIQGAVATHINDTPPVIFYQLKVVNSGGQSVAWKWHLKIILTSGQKIDLDAVEGQSSQTFVDPTTQKMISKFDADSYLPNILLENPLLSGAGKMGWVVFKVDNADDNDLMRIGNKFILKFEDCDGNETSITNLITEKGGKMQRMEN